MRTYVFVHGSWHGGWCWYKVKALLEKAGHKVIAPDLPGLGKDRTPLTGITLDMWTRSICQVLDAQSVPSILVGHSRGGIVISQAAERYPGKIRTLVYVTAFLLRDGESAREVLHEDGTSLTIPNLKRSADQGSSMIREEAIQEVFYGECSAEDVALASSLLVPEPVGPAGTPIHITSENFGRVPRAYIECLRDKAIPPALQKRMYTAMPCQKIFSIDTDHSPFFSRAGELVGHLLAL